MRNQKYRNPTEEAYNTCSDSDSTCNSDIDLESGELEHKVHEIYKKDCRICYLRLIDENTSNSGEENECSEAIELGCSCKGNLAGAQMQCAESWFEIRGNTTCEICGATAVNVVGEQTNDSNATIAASTATSAPPTLYDLGDSKFLPRSSTHEYITRLYGFCLYCLLAFPF